MQNRCTSGLYVGINLPGPEIPCLSLEAPGEVGNQDSLEFGCETMICLCTLKMKINSLRTWERPVRNEDQLYNPWVTQGLNESLLGIPS